MKAFAAARGYPQASANDLLYRDVVERFPDGKLNCYSMHDITDSNTKGFNNSIVCSPEMHPDPSVSLVNASPDEYCEMTDHEIFPIVCSKYKQAVEATKRDFHKNNPQWIVRRTIDFSGSGEK